jgi:Protein of unknown function (DUF3667).
MKKRETIANLNAPAKKQRTLAYKKCLNCDSLITDKYCAHCGQSSDTQRLSLKTMAENIFSGITSFDRGGWHTIILLFSRPGKLVRDYINGKRVEYSKPFGLLAILCGLYGFMSLLLYSYQETSSGITDPLIQVLNDLNLNDPIIRWICGNMLFLNLILTPLYALFIRWMFSGKRFKRYNFTEMLYLTVFWLCQIMIVNILILPFTYQMVYSMSLMIILLLLTTLLLGWFLQGFFNVGWFHAIGKSLLINVFPIIIIFLITVIAIIVCYS